MRWQSEPERLRSLKAGDRAAFDAIYAQYRPRLYGFLLRLTQRRHLAEELLQETWLRLAMHAARLDDDTELGAWLFTVARRLFVSQRRWALLDAERLRELGLWPRTTSQPSPLELSVAGDTARRLERALGELPVTYREAWLLVAVEGMEPQAAAAVLDVKPEALRQRLARARAMLAERLGEKG